MTDKSRILWVDYAKGLGIFLVVLGHLIRSLVNSKIILQSSIITFEDSWIYAFHMPLFFLLSGLFIHKSLSKSFGKFFQSRLQSIVYPYFFWSILQGILQIFFSHYTNHEMKWSELAKIWYAPIMQYWFFYCLFIIVITYGLLYQITKEKTPLYFLILSIIVYGFNWLNINMLYLGILYTSWLFSLYFAIGVWLGIKPELLSKLNYLSNKNLILFSIFGFTILSLGIILDLTNQSSIKPLFAIIGSISTILISIFLERINCLNEIKKWGEFSLEIFVAHTIFCAFLRVILQNVLLINNFFVHLLLGMIVGIYFPIILTITLKKLKIGYVFKFDT
ncbi:acyltransferase family protein [Geminocystis sp.]|uniref:acyltransferase family protein n=1 Tax=Geminocystis sp. TaxID=2664100 RepID=UPI003592FDC5